MKFLDIDGPLIQFLSRMADLMWLNILTIICCIPIITAGASLTALHYMALKIVRDEESYITRGFFRAFKENFLQSTAIWCLFIVVAGVLTVDYRIITTANVEINKVFQVVLLAVAIMVLFTFVFVFPVQAKFSNTVRRTILNSFLFSIMQFPKTVLMIIMYALPYVMVFLWFNTLPVFLVFHLSLPAFLSAKLYNKFFLRLEEQILAREGREGEPEADGEDERIFKDELDTSIEISHNN